MGVTWNLVKRKFGGVKSLNEVGSTKNVKRGTGGIKTLWKVLLRSSVETGTLAAGERKEGEDGVCGKGKHFSKVGVCLYGDP